VPAWGVCSGGHYGVDRTVMVVVRGGLGVQEEVRFLFDVVLILGKR
jgi:hypothetical protein